MQIRPENQTFLLFSYFCLLFAFWSHFWKSFFKFYANSAWKSDFFTFSCFCCMQFTPEFRLLLLFYFLFLMQVPIYFFVFEKHFFKFYANSAWKSDFFTFSCFCCIMNWVFSAVSDGSLHFFLVFTQHANTKSLVSDGSLHFFLVLHKQLPLTIVYFLLFRGVFGFFSHFPPQ